MASSCIRGGLDWIAGIISLLMEWSVREVFESPYLEVFKIHVHIALQDVI